MHDEPEDDPSQGHLLKERLLVLGQFRFPRQQIERKQPQATGDRRLEERAPRVPDPGEGEAALAALQAAPDAVLAPDAVAQNVVKWRFGSMT